MISLWRVCRWKAVGQRYGLLLCLVAYASGAAAGELEVSNPWIRLLPAGVPSGGYFTLRNGGNEPAVLVSISSTAFGSIMMHRTVEEQGRSRMLSVDQIEVAAGKTMSFAPGGYHLMLMKPIRDFAIGERVPITLEFLDKHKITVQFEVRGPTAK